MDYDASRTLLERHLTIANGENTFYIETATGSSDDVVILLHGYGGNSFTWIPLINRLPATTKVYALDLRGCGDSTFKNPFYSFDDVAEDLKHFVNVIGIKHIRCLVGHSIGGAIAMCYAAKNPAKVQSLVLVNSVAPNGFFAKGVRYPAEEMEKMTSHFIHMFESKDIEFVEQVWMPGRNLLPEHTKIFDRLISKAFNTRALKLYHEVSKKFNIADRLKRYKNEVLVVVGENDHQTEENAKFTASCFGGKTQTKVMSGTRFSPFLEAADAFAEDFVAFLKSQKKFQPISNGEVIAYKEYGSGEKLFVMIHGWSVDSSSFCAVYPHLEKDLPGYTILVPDTRGHGNSSLNNNIYSFEDHVQDLELFLKAKGVSNKRFWLLGHSYGGVIASRYAITYPDKVERLIMMCSLTADGWKEENLRDGLVETNKRYDDYMKTVHLNDMPSLLKRHEKDKQFLGEEFHFLRVNMTLRCRALWHDLALVRRYCYCDYDKIICPTLIIFGENDYLLTEKSARKMEETIGPRSVVLVLKNVGHSPNIEIPKGFSAEIKKFIRTKRGSVSSVSSTASDV